MVDIFEQYNRENMDIVDLKETPITEMTEKGIRTSDGKEHELEVIIFATGCDLQYLSLTWGSFRSEGEGGARVRDYPSHLQIRLTIVIRAGSPPKW